jgi:hypothetical protein
MAGEYAPSERPPGPDCTDRQAWGTASTLNQYIAKQFIRSEDDYPADACSPYYYSRAQIDNFQVNTALTGSGNINISGTITTSSTVSASEVTAGGVTLTSRKAFDIPHPTKEGYRLRHICVEGPESAVYFRGRVTNKKEIILPDYWKKLVDWTTITVNLTPIGSHQSVIVKRFDEEKIYLQSNGGIPIDCFFHVYAERADGERLIAEYEGETFEDYPGDNSQYTCNK